MGNLIITVNGADACGVAVRTRLLGWFMPSATDASTYAEKRQTPGSRLSPDST